MGRPAARSSTSPVAGDIAGALEAWFARSARPLPWRTTPRDPYLALVSEAMLQQTQVARVVERFNQFIARYPTLESLAAADESDVLALWSGLGYYRRARNLHAAAREICQGRGNGSVFPSSAVELRLLPGIGPYTAGSIASIVFEERTPLVDGNVARVLLRLDARRGHAADKATTTWLWKRAGQLVDAAHRPSLLNEGLMELGATVCTPAAPRCDQCPLAHLCLARARGLQSKIPAPKPRPTPTRLYCGVVLARHSRRGLLIEQRDDAARGVSGRMWAGMWQAPTLERADRAPSRDELCQWIGLPLSDTPESFVHGTTHRTVHFEVWTARAARGGMKPLRGTWAADSHIAALALSSPQRRILLGAPPTA